MEIVSFKNPHFLFIALLLITACNDKNSVKSNGKDEIQSAEMKVEKTLEPTNKTPIPSPVETKIVEPSSIKKKIPTGKLVLTLLENEEKKHPGLIRFKLGNGLSEDIESARAWVILLDAQDKIVGQKAFWLSQKENIVLGTQQEREWTTLIDASGIPKTTKITFSVINGSSGNSIHPESVLILELPK